jgi:hypothetical protein
MLDETASAGEGLGSGPRGVQFLVLNDGDDGLHGDVTKEGCDGGERGRRGG